MPGDGLLQVCTSPPIAIERAMKVDATFERAPLTLSSLYMSERKAEKAVEVLISNNFIFSCVQMHIEVSIILLTRSKVLLFLMGQN